MTCTDCDNAAKAEWHGFTAGCKGCAARSVSRLPQYRKVRDAGMLDRHYLDLCAQFGVTHEQVKQAAWLDTEASSPLQL